MKNILIYVVSFLPLWVFFFCAMADFVFMFDARAYTMLYGAISFLICYGFAGEITDRYGN